AHVTAFCTGRPWRLADVDYARLERIDARRWWDAAVVAGWDERLRGAGAVVCLAYLPPSEDSDAEAHERSVNLAGASSIARAARRADATFVFTSSAEVYGSWHDDPVDEATEPSPSSVYGRVKLETEHVVA